MFKNKLVILIIAMLFLPWIWPGNRVAIDFPLSFYSGATAGFNWPQTWTTRFGNGLGEYSVGTLWAWPIDFAHGAAATAGINFATRERVLGLLPAIAFSYLGMILLAGPIAALIYIANSYFLLLIDGGQLGLAIAYGLFPVCVYLYFQIGQKESWKAILKFIFFVVCLSIADIRIIYFLILLISAHFLYQAIILHKMQIKLHLQTALLTGLFLIGFHSYWILPALATRHPALPPSYTAASEIAFLSFANLNHALLLSQPHWPENIFGHISFPVAGFIILPFLAFLTFSSNKTNKIKFFWGTAALAGIFLVKGSNPPLSSLYGWLFIHLPGFSLFRDPTKFYFLIALGYAILIAGVFQSHIKWAKILNILLVMYLGVLIYPIISRKMTGTFSSARFEKDYAKLNKQLSQDQDFGRILWVPSKSPLGFSGANHPTIEGLSLQKIRPFTIGTFGTYETMSFLRDASASAKLLQMAGIKYVIVPPLDPKRDSTKTEDLEYNHNFFQQLLQTNWAGKVQNFGAVSSIQTNRPISLFYLPNSIKFVVGSDDIYDSLDDLTNTATVFVEDQPGLINQKKRFSSAEVVLNHKSLIDAAAAMIEPSNLTFLAKNLSNAPNKNGWWKRDSNDFLWLRNFLQSKYGLDNQDFDYQGGWAIAEGNLQFDTNIPLTKKSQFVLLARVLHSPISGNISFYQNDNKIGELSTLDILKKETTITVKGLAAIPDKNYKFLQSEFYWTPIGQIDGSNGNLTIKTQGKINIINTLALVSVDDWQLLQKQAGQMIMPKDLSSSKASVSYQKISPTHYKLSVTGLKQPGMLVFSQNYDALWELNGQKPVPVYSFLNGFPVDHDGVFDLIFTPQNYVPLGLAVSALTIVIYLSLVVILNYAKKTHRNF